MCISHRKRVFFNPFFFHPKTEGENKSQGTATIESLLVKKESKPGKKQKGNRQVFVATMNKDIKEKVVNIK